MLAAYGREVGARAGGGCIGDHQNLAASAHDHLRQHGAAGIHYADDVGLKNFLPIARAMFDEGPDGTEHRGVGDQDVNGPVELGHAVDGGGELFEIAHVGAKAVCDAARMFDFEFGEVEFALAATKEPDAEAGAGETNRKPLSDSPPGASDQRGHLLVRVQMRILPPGRARRTLSKDRSGGNRLDQVLATVRN